MSNWISTAQSLLRRSLRPLPDFRKVEQHDLNRNDATLSPSTPSDVVSEVLSESQTVLLLSSLKQGYELVHDYPVPTITSDNEVLVKTRAIGLNPIDWKGPDFNIAIPHFPYLSGRESSGEIVHTESTSTRLRPGDRVILISTDYHDNRKATFQEYTIGFEFCIARLPSRFSFEEGSTLGVAFVAAALSLGVCMGVNFSEVLDGPDLLGILRSVDPNALADDVRDECLGGIEMEDRAGPDDWLAIWGGSSTSANLTIQLARLAGIKTAAIIDVAKHGHRQSEAGAVRPDLLIDSYDPQRAVSILNASLGPRLRFGLDTRGSASAAFLLEALSDSSAAAPSKPLDMEGIPPPSPPFTPLETSPGQSAHLVGLAGLPKRTAPTGCAMHAVPIKVFHEVPQVGLALVTWLERLLEQGLLSAPQIIDVEQGLESVNKGLDRMRSGEISGGKLVVKLVT